VTTRPTIARTAARSTDRVHQVSYYPLSRCFNAIDLTFAAAGYNSFHEQIAFAVPTAFVPNVLTQTDDQDARARHAGETGTGVYLPQAEGPALAEAVARLTDPDARALVADRCRQLYPGNGAGEAIAHVQHLIGVRGET
jgi:UDP:flavonoid glycosyltransferase YjiC (YdhE family)